MRLSRCSLSLSRAVSRSPKPGIFGSPGLVRPADFPKAAADAQQRSQAIVAEILKPHAHRSSGKKAVHLLDDVSNTICLVADLSDCVRVNHPDPAFRDASDQSLALLSELVESFNSSPELYKAVKDSMELEKDLLDDLDRRTLQLFIDDFEQCGVHLDEKERREFVRLSNRIYQLSSEFFAQAGALPSSGLYTRHNAAQESTLTQLLAHRDQLARLTGFRSFADRAQQHTIMADADKATQFLLEVKQDLQPALAEEMEQVRRLLSDAGRAPTSQLHMWDLEMAGRLKHQQIQREHGDLSRHLSFAHVLQGFEQVCRRLYGVRFEVQKADAAEVWPGPVFKLGVHRADEFLGTVYVDGEQRPDKVHGDCHFTVRCSKLLDDNTLQKPVVVLTLGFFGADKADLPLKELLASVQLRPQQAENFFHEMGHAMHSMLGRTRYQHVAGTRCPTDFAEVPSNLMECFFKQDGVLEQFLPADGGGLIVPEAARALRADLNVLPASAALLQVLYGLFDLELHSGPLCPSTTSTSLYARLSAEVFPEVRLPADFAFHHQMTHLVTYGAKYYSYTVAKACASLIWQRHFAAEPLGVEAGARWARVQGLGGERASADMMRLALERPFSGQELAHALRLHCQARD